MDVEWVKIVSWHIIRTWTRVPGRAIVLCGRVATGHSSDVLPSGEKSCETCLRVHTRRTDV